MQPEHYTQQPEQNLECHEDPGIVCFLPFLFSLFVNLHEQIKGNSTTRVKAHNSQPHLPQVIFAVLTLHPPLHIQPV